MKFLVIILLGIALYGNTSDTYAWDSTAAKYMPLQVGNIWVYYGSRINVITQCFGYEKYEISGTSQINGHMYFTLVRTIKPLNTTNCGSFYVSSRLFGQNYLRIDSTNMSLFGTESCQIDSLASRKGDSELVCIAYTHYNPSYCDTSTIMKFGLNKLSKTFTAYTFESYVKMSYAKDIGFYHYHLFQPGPNNVVMDLRGCVINGVVYGDTSMIVGINQISTEIPEKFTLSQNYPNPFNPVSKIKFSIPLSRGVSEGRGVLTQLSIYDALGREVAVLVNQQLQPGTYEADWDASSYPSGVYYYRLESGDFKETKKMVLIK